jgi:ribonuclease HI
VNPGGTGAWAYLLRLNDDDSTVLDQDWGTVRADPAVSNNRMEYMAVAMGLEHVRGLVARAALGRASHLLVHADSKLVIEQLAGRWRVGGGLYLPQYQRAKTLLDLVRPVLSHVTLEWVRREDNRRPMRSAVRPWPREVWCLVDSDAHPYPRG